MYSELSTLKSLPDSGLMRKKDHGEVFVVFLSHAYQVPGQYCNLSDYHFLFIHFV